MRFRTLSRSASGTGTAGRHQAAPADATDNSEKLTVAHRPLLSVCLRIQGHAQTETRSGTEC